MLRRRAPRLQRRPHRPAGRGGARGHALVRGARVGDVGPGRRRRRAAQPRTRPDGSASTATSARPRRLSGWPRSSSPSARAARAGSRPRSASRSRSRCSATCSRRRSAHGDRVRLVTDDAGRRARRGGARRRGRRRSRRGPGRGGRARARRSRRRLPRRQRRPAARAPVRPRRARDPAARSAPSRSSRRADGTTNALALPFAEVFQPLYGPGSAAAVPGARGRARPRPRRARPPNLATTSTRSPISSAIGPRGGAAHACARWRRSRA